MTIIDMDTLTPPRGRRFMAASIERWTAARDKLWAEVAARCDARHAPKPPPLKPIVVQPGVRVEQHQNPCPAAVAFARKAEATDHQVYVTHARRLDPPTARNPQWTPRQSVVVRWRFGDQYAGWCAWEADDRPGAGWSFDTAMRAEILGERSVGMPRHLNATQAADWTAARGSMVELVKILVARMERATTAKRKPKKEMEINA